MRCSIVETVAAATEGFLWLFFSHLPRRRVLVNQIELIHLVVGWSVCFAGSRRFAIPAMGLVPLLFLECTAVHQRRLG